MRSCSLFRVILAAGCVAGLAGCGGGSPPAAPAVTASTPEARAIFDACLAAHGGQAAYARLHDVNVRFDSHWAAFGPSLQPVLSDRGHRGGSEERYLPAGVGFVVGQHHRGPKGEKQVFRQPPDHVEVAFNPLLVAGDPAAGAGFGRSLDPDVLAAASLVADAYSMFLFGPEFFVRRHAVFQKLAETADVDGHACDELRTTLRPGLGADEADEVTLFIDRQDHVLRRVRFTLNALESTRGAAVHVDLMAHRRLAGVLWPTRFDERIDKPVGLSAHQWSLLGFDANRGYDAADLDTPRFRGLAAASAKALP